MVLNASFIVIKTLKRNIFKASLYVTHSGSQAFYFKHLKRKLWKIIYQNCINRLNAMAQQYVCEQHFQCRHTILIHKYFLCIIHKYFLWRKIISKKRNYWYFIAMYLFKNPVHLPPTQGIFGDFLRSSNCKNK